MSNILSPYRLHLRKKQFQPGAAFFVSNKLFRRYTALVALLFIITSFSSVNILSAYASEQEIEGTGTSSFEDSLLIEGDEYFMKVSPQTQDADRSGMTDRATYIVQSGDTLSTIARQFQVKTSTILWENNIGNANAIRPGQILTIPPVDGVNHQVEKNQNLEKIAKIYGVEVKEIQQHNEQEVLAHLAPGQEIFIPGGKPIPAPEPLPSVVARNTPARAGTSTRQATAALSRSNDKVARGKLLFPTRGIITQRFHGGHPAYDIANASKPPLWAADDGVVIIATSSGWNGGYGRYVRIDHGNGLTTTYGHMDSLSVKVGQRIKQGDVIGRMGNTGNVRGRTGIHVHFEVSINGRKISPGAYLGR